MFINSLFLSKLLNQKSEKPTSGIDSNGFSHLFSEIIKIKNASDETAFVPENIGGTLLDHKIIFISNASPLENRLLYRSNSSIKIIENLFRLFTSENMQLKNDSESQTLSLNKITTDKNQFLKSIETLIRNILNETNNQNKEVEIRYVSKNLIETKKINNENLSQFSDYLSNLIDGNQSFSFVIGANLKQILFDVENLALTTEDKINLQFDTSTDNNTLKSSTSIQNKAVQVDKQIELKTDLKENFIKNIPEEDAQLIKTENQKSLKPLATTYGDYEKLVAPTNDKHKQDTISLSKANKNVSDEQKFGNEILSQDSNQFKKLIDSNKSIKQNFNDVLKVGTDNITENQSSNEPSKSENKNVSLKLNKQMGSISSVTTKQRSSTQEIQTTIESEVENKNSIQSQKTEKPDLQFKDIGEVKIVIKEKSQFVSSKDENQIVLGNPKKEAFNLALKQNKLTIKSEAQDIRIQNSEYSSRSFRSIIPEFPEKDLPSIISAKADEPRITRVGLPLIADYQDWDLVFDKSTDQIKNVFEHYKTITESTSKKEEKQAFKDQNSSEIKETNADKINSGNSKPKNELEKPTEQKPNNLKANVKEHNNQVELKENILQLKISGEKKIAIVAESIKENVISSSEQIPKNVIEKQSSVNEKVSANVDSNKSSTAKNLVEQETTFEHEIKLHNTESTDHKHFENQNQSKGERSKIDIDADKINDEENILNEKAFKSEVFNSTKQFVQPEIKSHLINNKTIVEHFIKNPVDSGTLEKFLQIMENQEIINKSEIVNYSKQNHSVEIKLSPKELGSIKIFLDTNDNNVSAKIEVGNEQTKAIVVNNLPQLKETLSQQGINLNNVNVTVSSEEQKNPEQTKQKNKKKTQDNNPKVEIAEERKAVRNLGYNTYEYLA